MTTRLTMRKPDDWHLHLRDEAMMAAVAPISAEYFSRALIMPNLVPPVITAKNAINYRERILKSLPVGSSFMPLMTLYLTETTDPLDVQAAWKTGFIKAVKLYPAGATTNSQSGVTDFEKVYDVLGKMADLGMPLCVHGEVTDPQVDIFDREAVFIDEILSPIRERFPELKIVMEHITTKDGVDYVASQNENMAATITTHHLIINRNHLLAGGIRPHYYCLPIVKRERHRQALLKAATGGDKRFFLGTDSAPHLDGAKQSACGCAGIFTASNTIECLAHVFEIENVLDRLEGFCSIHGANFYSMAPNEERIELLRQSSPQMKIPAIETPEGKITIFDPDFDVYWQVQ